jgi:UDP-sugar transporter A1/2/3
MANPPGSPILSSAPLLGEPTPEKPSRTSSVISLLGLAPSRTPSRAPSRENLKALSSLNPSYGYQFTNGNHVYAASAPGTPYFSPSSVNGYSGSVPNPYDTPTQMYEQGTMAPPQRRGAPLPSTNGHGPAFGPGSGLGLPGRKGSQSGESNCSSLGSGGLGI